MAIGATSNFLGSCASGAPSPLLALPSAACTAHGAWACSRARPPPPRSAAAGVSGGALNVTSFKFAPASAEQAPGGPVASSLEQLKHGRLQVTVYDGRAAGTEAPGVPFSSAQPGGQQQELQLPEGKKFFLAPSLKCAAGGTKAGGQLSLAKYEKVGLLRRRAAAFRSPVCIAAPSQLAPRPPALARQVGPPLLELELRYETASTLLLRKVLDPGKPAHAAILAEFGDEGGLGPGPGRLACAACGLLLLRRAARLWRRA
jgi:hypothetical protein